MQLDTPKCAHTVDRSRPSRTLGAPRDGVFHARSDQTVGRRRSFAGSPLQEMLPELWCDGSCPYNYMAPTYPCTVTTDTPPSIYDTTAATWPRRRSRRRQRQLQPLATAGLARPAPGTALSAIHSLASPGHVEVRALQQLRYTQASGGTQRARCSCDAGAQVALEPSPGAVGPLQLAVEPRPLRLPAVRLTCAFLVF